MKNTDRLSVRILKRKNVSQKMFQKRRSKLLTTFWAEGNNFVRSWSLRGRNLIEKAQSHKFSLFSRRKARKWCQNRYFSLKHQVWQTKYLFQLNDIKEANYIRVICVIRKCLFCWRQYIDSGAAFTASDIT